MSHEAHPPISYRVISHQITVRQMRQNVLLPDAAFEAGALLAAFAVAEATVITEARYLNSIQVALSQSRATVPARLRA
jgi:hypothetical protein